MLMNLTLLNLKSCVECVGWLPNPRFTQNFNMGVIMCTGNGFWPFCSNMHFIFSLLPFVTAQCQTHRKSLIWFACKKVVQINMQLSDLMYGTFLNKKLQRSSSSWLPASFQQVKHQNFFACWCYCRKPQIYTTKCQVLFVRQCFLDLFYCFSISLI